MVAHPPGGFLAVPHPRRGDLLRAAIDRVRTVGPAPERLCTLLDAIAGLTSELDPHRLFQCIVDTGCRLTGAARGVFAVRAEGRREYREYIEFVTRGVDLHEAADAITGPCFTGFPVRTHDTVFGELFLDPAGRPFGTEDLAFIRALAAAAAVAMGNARMLAGTARRQQWLEASAEITHLLLAEEVQSQRALTAVVRRARELLGADLALLCLRHESDDVLVVEVADGLGADELAGRQFPLHSLAGAVMRDGKRTVLYDSDSDPDAFRPPEDWGVPPLGPGIVVPLTSGTRMYGALEVFTVQGSPIGFDDVDAALAEAFAGQAAIALDRVRAGHERQLLAIFEERDRIARDLHDVVIQRLFGAGLKLQSAARIAMRPGVTQRVESVVDELDATIQDIRRMIFHLHTAHDEGHLRARLAAVVAESAPALRFTPTLLIEIPPAAAHLPDDVVEDLLAVVREALANCVRHADAEEVEVRVSVGDRVSLTVLDDGRPRGNPAPRTFDPPADRSASLAGTPGGLRSMRERAERRGGHFSMTTRPDGGTCVQWEVPAHSTGATHFCPSTPDDSLSSRTARS